MKKYTRDQIEKAFFEWEKICMENPEDVEDYDNGESIEFISKERTDYLIELIEKNEK